MTRKPFRPCSIPDCDKPAAVRSYYWGHYYRWRTYGGNPLGGMRMRQPAHCVVPQCRRKARSLGYCHGHYMRRWRRGDVQPDVPIGQGR